jgi:hypothetical protein
LFSAPQLPAYFLTDMGQKVLFTVTIKPALSKQLHLTFASRPVNECTVRLLNKTETEADIYVIDQY